jgi:hypothetical protein
MHIGSFLRGNCKIKRILRSQGRQRFGMSFLT